MNILTDLMKFHEKWMRNHKENYINFIVSSDILIYNMQFKYFHFDNFHLSLIISKILGSSSKFLKYLSCNQLFPFYTFSYFYISISMLGKRNLTHNV